MKIRQEDTHQAKLLIVEREDAAGSFEDRMIRSLESRYILTPLTDGDPDGGAAVYDITAYEPFSEYLVNRRLSRREMVGFLAQLRSVILCLEDHMLTDACLLLEPGQVMVDLESRKVRFIAAGTAEGDFGTRFRPLAEELFRHADLDDPETLRFAADLMVCCLGTDLKLHDLQRLIERQKAPVPMRRGPEIPAGIPALPLKSGLPEREPEERQRNVALQRRAAAADPAEDRRRNAEQPLPLYPEKQAAALPEENATRALPAREDPVIPFYDAEYGFAENQPEEKKEGIFSALKESACSLFGKKPERAAGT